MEEFKNKKLNQNEDIVNFLHSEEGWKKLDRFAASAKQKKRFTIKASNRLK